MADRRGQSCCPCETLNAVDHVPVQGAQRGHVDGADGRVRARVKRFQDREEHCLRFPGTGRRNDENIRPVSNLGDRRDLHRIEARDSGTAKQVARWGRELIRGNF